ncbi:MAG: TonB-dependent receptor, partial [Cyclobacteriaceae bacterium]
EFYFLFTPFIGYFHNYIYLRPGTTFSRLPTGGQVWQYTQHNTLFTGFELTTDVHFTENLVLRPAIEYVYNYNFQTGLALPFTPPLSTFTELEYSPKLRTNAIIKPYMSFSNRWFADQNRRDINEQVTPGAALFHFNMGFGVKVFGQLAEFNFGVENLTNTKYMMHTSRYRLLNLPEQGRNFIFSLRIPFGIE